MHKIIKILKHKKKQGPGTQEFGKTNVRGREAGLPD